MDKQPRLVIQRLPPLTEGTASWSLPLADHTARDLAHLLLLDSIDSRTAAAADLMSIDPAFALWCACATGANQDEPPRCVIDLAGWFAASVRQTLRWPGSDVTNPGGSPDDRDLRPRWRELTADAMAVANLAADLADDDAAAAEAFLFGLLHNASDWLRSCGPRVSPARQKAGCLPPWLVVWLAERAKGPRSQPVRLVMRAGTLWREAGRRGIEVAGVDLSEVRAIRQRWRSAASHPLCLATLLPSLAVKLKRLDDLERRFAELLEQEKLAALGELAYGASHEINNPLANISARAQSMLRDEADPERRRTLAVINTQAFRANEMIADMMLFARPPELVVDRVNVIGLIDDVLGELVEEAEQQGTRLTRDTAVTDPLDLWMDGTQIAVALRALCLNALESLSAGGEVEVLVEDAVKLGDHPGDWVRISVRDTGPGIAPEIRRHLFDPFFSGREAGRGLGLGLSKCWRIVTLHRGRVEVVSQPGKGATLAILLPAAPSVASSNAETNTTVSKGS